MKRRIAAALIFAGPLLAQLNPIQKAHDDYCYHHDDEPICNGKGSKLIETSPIITYRPPSMGNKPAVPKPASAAVVSAPAVLMAPLSVRRGEIDWRFLQPKSTIVAGLNLAAVQRSVVARDLLAKLLPDSNQLLDRAADIEQIGISKLGDSIVVMLAGQLASAELPTLPSGLKVVRVSDNQILLGHSAAVDGAATRLTHALQETADMQTCPRECPCG